MDLAILGRVVQLGLVVILYHLFFWSNVVVVDAQIFPGPIVDTQYGQILGNRRLFQGQFYEEFLGIPFAAPPVDEFRWAKPQPLEPWDDVWNGTEYSIHCTQLVALVYPFIGLGGRSGEDCLYLNIWVPRGVAANEDNALPVMFFIYGGAYILGTGEMYPGHALALHGDMILVNFNYRVGTLGFLSTGDSALPGNYGLWDTQAALQWVHDNIASFNGDPNRVTVFGQSAGASMTSHAVISAQTNTLFQNAIAISGASTGFFGTTTQALRTAVLVANLMNCTFADTPELVDCLHEKNPHALDFWGLVGGVAYEGRLPNFLPVLDGDFIPRPPSESFQNGDGKDINFITGNTHHDAANFIILNPIGIPALGDNNNVARSNETLWNAFLVLLGGTSNPIELTKSIMKMYPDLESSDNFTRTLAAAKACTEWWFGSGSNWEAVNHFNAQGLGKTFQYHFQYHQSFLVGYPDWINGTHIDDLYSVFGEPFMLVFKRLFLGADFDDLDKQISENIMDYYSNFAHTGDPNEGPFSTAVEWKEFNPLDQHFLRQSSTFELSDFYEDNMVDRYRFWTDSFYDQVEFPPSPISSSVPSFDDFPRLTEEEVERGIETLKKLLSEFVFDDVVWAELEETIDQFVEDRKYGRF